MVRKCLFCGSERGIGEKTYHKFPLNDKQLLQSWLQNMRLSSNFSPKKHHHLCSDHFEEECFENCIGKRCLRRGSTPTLFGEYKSVCVCCRAVKGQDKKSFHKFPRHDPELLRKWIAAINFTDFTPTEKSLICDDHFDEKFLQKRGQHSLLKANAVPTLFVSPESTSASLYEDNEAATNRLSGSDCEIMENPVCSKIPETPRTIKKRVLRMNHDHQYELTLKTMRKRLGEQQNKIEALTNRSRVQNQHISRLKKKVTTLKEIVSELHEELAQFLKRFAKKKDHGKSKHDAE